MQHHNYQGLGLQHLAYLRQQQTRGDHNPWAAEAALEAHLSQQHTTPHQVGAQPRLQPQHQ